MHRSMVPYESLNTVMYLDEIKLYLPGSLLSVSKTTGQPPGLASCQSLMLDVMQRPTVRRVAWKLVGNGAGRKGELEACGVARKS